ncbi:MAG TPA: hypothetical protein VFU19_14275 [Iamia sp.]|nr:hypothetical protein [Iamia sp.]
MRRRLLPTLALATTLALAGAACSDDAEDAVDEATQDIQDGAEDAVTSASEAIDEGSDAAAETAVRNLAATHGADEFAQAGHEIDGDLTCEATVAEGADAVDVTCTGTTVDGDDAELTGTTSELPGASATELEGSFTGTVAGEEAFAVDRLGGQ